MEREILFRGFCPNKNGKQIITLDGEDIRGDWKEGYYWSNELGNHFIKVVRDSEGNFINPEEYEVEEATVCQYTGLKDKYGKRIWEGDIVTGLFNHTDIIGHIVYSSDATFFIERKGLYGIGLNNAEDWLEVIGNIHDKEE